MGEGGKINFFEAFSKKYRVIKKLGSGLNGQVYLVEHRNLKVLRALKVISVKNNKWYENFKSEVMILKNLRYPGIPIIYDMEEAEDYLYIFEEYIKGETLYERVNNTGVMSKEEIISLGINFCKPIIYLHNQKIPIIHLDIHPGNLILNDKSVNLIDFDHSRWLDNKKIKSEGFGTRGYASPEQYMRLYSDERTDIYSIGAVLYYAGTGFYPGNDISFADTFGNDLKKIIEKCINKDKNCRYKNVISLKESLENIANYRNPSHKIIMLASERGSGSTYISLGFASYLKSNGITPIYKEKNNYGHMDYMMENFVEDKKSYFRLNNIGILSNKSDKSKYMSASYNILDYGNDVDSAMDETGDCFVIVCKGDLWHLNGLVDVINKIKKIKDIEDIHIIFNLIVFSQKEFMKHSTQLLIDIGILYRNIYFMPYIENIMENNKERNIIFKKILRKASDICEEDNLVKRLMIKHIGISL